MGFSPEGATEVLIGSSLLSPLRGWRQTSWLFSRSPGLAPGLRTDAPLGLNAKFPDSFLPARLVGPIGPAALVGAPGPLPGSVARGGRGRPVGDAGRAGPSSGCLAGGDDQGIAGPVPDGGASALDPHPAK